MKTILLAMVGLLMIFTGCATYGGGGYYDDTVGPPDPDMYLFGGDYGRGRDVRHYSQRGAESRGAAHGGGSHAAAHSGGGHGGRR